MPPVPCVLEPVTDKTLAWPAAETIVFTSKNASATFELLSAEGLSVIPGSDRVTVKAEKLETRLSKLVIGVRCSDAPATQSEISIQLKAPHWGTAIEWSGSAGPAAREHTVIMSDPQQPDALWVFGGYGFVPQQFTLVPDLWQFNLQSSTWSQVVPQGVVPAAGGARAVRDEAGHRWLLFGGSKADGSFQTDVTVFDATVTPPRFSKLTTAGPGPETQLHALAWDAAHQRLISFGGVTTTDVLDGVEVFSVQTSSWVSSNAFVGSPEPRYGAFAAVDPVGAELIVFSGAQQPRAIDPVNPAEDTWALSFADDALRWRRIEGPTPEASARRNGCSAFDTKTRRFYVWSGTPDGATPTEQLSMLDLTETQPHWRALELSNPAPARGSCTAVFDAPRRRILFGFGNTIGTRFTDFQVLELE